MGASRVRQGKRGGKGKGKGEGGWEEAMEEDEDEGSEDGDMSKPLTRRMEELGKEVQGILKEKIWEVASQGAGRTVRTAVGNGAAKGGQNQIAVGSHTGEKGQG